MLSVLLVVDILSSLAIALLQRENAMREAAAARAQAARANTMRDFIFDAFAEAEPSVPRAGPATITDVVERALAMLRVEQGSDPRARIELSIRLAEVLSAQGKLVHALLAAQYSRKRQFPSRR